MQPVLTNSIRTLALLGGLLGGQIQSTQATAEATYEQIVRLRHTRPGEALAAARKANAAAKTSYSVETAQRFTLLLANILIEQRMLAEAETYLTLRAENGELSARLLAAKAYLEQQKDHDDSDPATV